VVGKIFWARLLFFSCICLSLVNLSQPFTTRLNMVCPRAVCWSRIQVCAN
jgi:hypothetical protein